MPCACPHPTCKVLPTNFTRCGTSEMQSRRQSLQIGLLLRDRVRPRSRCKILSQFHPNGPPHPCSSPSVLLQDCFCADPPKGNQLHVHGHVEEISPSPLVDMGIVLRRCEPSISCNPAAEICGTVRQRQTTQSPLDIMVICHHDPLPQAREFGTRSTIIPPTPPYHDRFIANEILLPISTTIEQRNPC
jgi:hypothetical protein